MSILKCHVTIHYSAVSLSSASSQGDSRGNNVSTRHIVPPLALPARPRKLSVSFGSSLFSGRSTPPLIGYVFARLSCIGQAPSFSRQRARPPICTVIYLFIGYNISDSLSDNAEIHRVVKSRFSAVSPLLTVNCDCSDNTSRTLYEFR